MTGLGARVRVFTVAIALGAITLLVGGFIHASAGERVAVADGSAAKASTCPVSRVEAEPVSGRRSFSFGNAHVAVSLPRDATFRAIPDGSPRGGHAFVQRDGWIRTKLGWWSDRGQPRVIGRRLDRAAPPLRADLGPLSWDPGGRFYPSLLYFSSTGCWRITATVRGARLDAVVRVVRQ